MSVSCIDNKIRHWIYIEDKKSGETKFVGSYRFLIVPYLCRDFRTVSTYLN